MPPDSVCGMPVGIALGGDIMKTYGIIGIAVLLLAGAAHAVNTVSTLTDKGWSQTEAGAVGPLGPSNEGGVGTDGLALHILDESEGVLPPLPDLYPDLWMTELEKSSVSLTDEIAGAAGGSTAGLIGPLDSDTGRGAGRHWNMDPRHYAGAGFADAGGSVQLPVFTELDWVLTPPPVDRTTFIMEIIVFPALGAMVLVLVVRLFILRLRMRRSPSRTEQLLRV